MSRTLALVALRKVSVVRALRTSMPIDNRLSSRSAILLLMSVLIHTVYCALASQLIMSGVSIWKLLSVNRSTYVGGFALPYWGR